MLTKENLLAIDCKHPLRAVSVLTFGSFTLYNYNFTIVSFSDVSKRLFNQVFESIYGYFLSQSMSLLNNYDTNYIVFLSYLSAVFSLIHLVYISRRKWAPTGFTFQVKGLRKK